MLGWSRIFFLDDDIRDLDPSGLQEAAWMLGSYYAIGMRAVNFPDNSVVCHGNRQTGGDQDVFVSGSALAVNCAEPVAFFPEIYNEDWFFFYHAAAARRLGRSRWNATQLTYDPFADPHRAAGQEFGDVMAEGLYALLHRRGSLEHATGDYWKSFLDSRVRFLKSVLAKSKEVEPYLRRRIVRSIEAAMTRSWDIEPSMCEHYIALWKQDLDAWQQRLKGVPRLLSAKAALRELDLVPSGPSSYVLAGIFGRRSDGISEDVTAEEVPIPASTAESIKASVALQGVGVITISEGSQLLRWDRPLEGRQVDAPARGVIGRVGRWAGEFALRAIVAKEPTTRTNRSREHEDGRPTGRHRKPSEPSSAIQTGNEEPARVG
jgi:hypothetical protein